MGGPCVLSPRRRVGQRRLAPDLDRQHQDGESLVIRVDFEEREELMNADPEKFYITDHYLNYPWMLVRLSKVRRDELSDLLVQSWRRTAPKRLLAAFHGVEEA